MIDSINDQMNKSDGSDTKILAEVFQDIVICIICVLGIMKYWTMYFIASDIIKKSQL